MSFTKQVMENTGITTYKELERTISDWEKRRETSIIN